MLLQKSRLRSRGLGNVLSCGTRRCQRPAGAASVRAAADVGPLVPPTAADVSRSFVMHQSADDVQAAAAASQLVERYSRVLRRLIDSGCEVSRSLVFVTTRAVTGGTGRFSTLWGSMVGVIKLDAG